MKELSIEEKAKRYDDLLVKLQKAKEDNYVCDERYCCVIDDIVPELKESEDEKIRQALIRFHKSTIDVDGIKGYEIVAWLEKQGEKKSIDDLTQQEAMDIAVAKCFEQGEQKQVINMKTPEESLGIDSDTYNKIVDECIYGEQNTAWSEEDEKMLGKCIDAASGYYSPEDKQSMKDWLKSLKERYTWKPSEEQMNALNYVVNLMASSERPTENDLYYNILKSLREQLKKLKE